MKDLTNLHYVKNGKQYLVQADADNQWGFVLMDEEQSWPGGFGSGFSSWHIVPITKVPKKVRSQLDFLFTQ